MNLPTEILLEVLHDLDKTTLKNARQVSKAWSLCAAEFLFTKVFISPHELNLEVFKKISNHAVLRKCVREIEYDSIHFRPDYLFEWHVWWLYSRFRKLYHMKTSSQLQSITQDPQFDEFAATVFTDTSFLVKDERVETDYAKDSVKIAIEFAKVEERLESLTYVKESYKHYMAQATFERSFSKSLEYKLVLLKAIQQFDRLDSAIINDAWSTVNDTSAWTLTCPKRRKGSPLAREGTRLDPRPEGWYHLKSERDGSRECMILLSALHNAQKRMRSFKVCRGVATLPLGTKFAMGQLQHIVHHTFGGLETLDFRFASQSPNPIHKARETTEVLRGLLESWTALRSLSLRFPYHLKEQIEAWLPYKTIFPDQGMWPQLSVLHISNTAIGIKDFIGLLSASVPRLQHLTLENINLLDGCWEGVIEFLRAIKRLSSFNLEADVSRTHRLLHCGQMNYILAYSLDPMDRKDYVDAIQDYAVDWRKNPGLNHPNLAPDQPKEKSLDFLDDVWSKCELPETGDIALELSTYTRENFI